MVVILNQARNVDYIHYQSMNHNYFNIEHLLINDVVHYYTFAFRHKPKLFVSLILKIDCHKGE